MSRADHFAVLMLAVAAASFACRSVGYFAMRFVKRTTRVDAGLKAIPLAAMLGVVVPAAIDGGSAERLALLCAAIVMKLSSNDFAAMVAAGCVAAVVRAVV
jgi:uncharacterized membrane protein